MTLNTKLRQQADLSRLGIRLSCISLLLISVSTFTFYALKQEHQQIDLRGFIFLDVQGVNQSTSMQEVVWLQFLSLRLCYRNKVE